mgnify:CR=1 FL=1
MQKHVLDLHGFRHHEIDVIVENPEAPTFANTIEELERTGKLLTKVARVFSN